MFDVLGTNMSVTLQTCTEIVLLISTGTYLMDAMYIFTYIINTLKPITVLLCSVHVLCNLAIS